MKPQLQVLKSDMFKTCGVWPPESFNCNQFEGSNLETGGRLNKKDGLTRYGDSHVKDKTS